MDKTTPILVLIIILLAVAIFLIFQILKKNKSSKNNLKEPCEEQEVQGQVKPQNEENKVEYSAFFDLDSFTDKEVPIEKNSEPIKDVYLDDIKENHKNEAEEELIKESESFEVEEAFDEATDNPYIVKRNIPIKENEYLNPEFNTHGETELPINDNKRIDEDNNIGDIINELKETYSPAQLEEIKVLLRKRPDLTAKKVKVMIEKSKSPERIRKYAERF